MQRKYVPAVLVPFILCVFLFPGCKELFHPGSGDDDDNNNGSNGQNSNSGLSAPTGLNAYIDNGVLHLSWNAVNGAEWYEYLVSDNPNGDYEAPSERMYGTSHSVTIDEDLVYFDKYIKIRACKNGEEGPLSVYYHLNYTPPPPEGLFLDAAAQSPESIQLDWNSISGADYYKIFRRKNDYDPYTTVTDRSEVPYFLDTGLESHTTYYYRVEAYSESGSKLSESGIVQGTTQPSKAINVSVSASTWESILDWNDVEGAGYYKIFRSNIFDDLTIHNAYVPDSYFEDYGLSPGTTYYYRVEAYSGSGSRIGESQAVSATTLMNIRAGALSPPGIIRIGWDRVGGADYYKVYRSESADGSYTITNNGGYVPDLTFEDTGLEPGTSYFYKVEAYSYSSPDLKISESSAVWAVTLPPVPDNLDLLSYNDWYNYPLSAGEVHRYAFYAVAGRTYYIQWDDEYNGTGEYDCDIRVSAFMYDTNYTFFDEDDGFTYPKPVTVTDSGYVIVRVERYSPESSGSYAIRFYE